MNKVTDYLKKGWEKLIEKLPTVQAQDSMMVIIAYGTLLGVISAAFLFAWIYNGLNEGRFNTNEMIEFFSVATGAGPVAAVTFLSIFLVDKDEDGRPDAAVEKAEKGETR